MPAVPYTIVLYSVFSAPGPFPMILPSPTQGTTWVIRDVCFYFSVGSGWFPLAAQATLIVGGVQIASTPAFRTFANTLYETRDIRQTLTAGGNPLELQALAPGWNLQVTGYAFS